MKYNGKIFDTDSTFLPTNGKSQIDFGLTKSSGRQKIRNFIITSEDWHMSDHRPISTEI